MKRILTVQDISCVGKCSGTVAVPVLSAMGVEACVLPTAVLSTHTGFSGFTFRDLTDDIPAVAAHWKNLDVRFDAFYSGYLGSVRQVQMIRELFSERRRPGDPILVDPVMADNGRFYAGFDEAYAEEMLSLCKIADVIVPNLTEACFLTGRPYEPHPSVEFQKDLLRDLASKGIHKIILTGVEASEDSIGAMCYDAEKDSFFLAQTKKIPCMFHGTGDLFASCVLGALCNGMPLVDAMTLAVEYISECIRVTVEDPDHATYGVEFENVFPWLLKKLGKF